MSCFLSGLQPFPQSRVRVLHRQPGLLQYIRSSSHASPSDLCCLHMCWVEGSQAKSTMPTGLIYHLGERVALLVLQTLGISENGG